MNKTKKWLPLVVLSLAACHGQASDTPGAGTISARRASNSLVGIDGGTPDLGGTGGSGAGAGAIAGAAAAAADAGLSDGTCLSLALQVEDIINTHCLECHGNGQMQGGFSVVQSVPMMIMQGRLIPKDRNNSRIYFLTSMGIMPQNNNKLTPTQVETLGQWIDCGATDWANSTPVDMSSYSFQDIRTRLTILNSHIHSYKNPTDRKQIRYIDLSNLANGGVTKDRIEVYRQVVSFLTNSLSFGRGVVPPLAIDPSGLIYAIDLRNYGWDAATWELIVAAYPYEVKYNEDSRLFNFPEDLAEELRLETGTNIPYIQADWFIEHATHPPLYYDILKIGEDINQVALNLGVNIAQNITDFQVSRAGFSKSGIAIHNRVIERHDQQPGDNGAFWITYDFLSSSGNQNIFAHPFDFVSDAGEGIYHLPNGLLAYFVANAQLQRLDTANPEIVNDPNTQDRLITASISCMGGCHLNRGLIPKDDEVGATAILTGVNAIFIEEVLGLYPGRGDFATELARDNLLYSTAVAKTGFHQTDDYTISNISVKHERELNAADAAAVLGIPLADFITALNAHPQEFDAEVLSLRLPTGLIFRETWDTDFAKTAAAIGLGTQITP